ncbi:MAG: HTH domain-containing protein, partial [Azovibrio sp.]|nr:HTH domain-containing protein [Azovibrio sp.]
MLRSRRSVSFSELMQRLEVSRATLYRDLAVAQDRLGLPLLKDEETRQYRIDRTADCQELPGLWFSPREIHALLSMQALLRAMDTG